MKRYMGRGAENHRSMRYVMYGRSLVPIVELMAAPEDIATSLAEQFLR